MGDTCNSREMLRALLSKRRKKKGHCNYNVSRKCTHINETTAVSIYFKWEGARWIKGAAARRKVEPNRNYNFDLKINKLKTWSNTTYAVKRIWLEVQLKCAETNRAFKMLLQDRMKKKILPHQISTRISKP